MGLQPRLLHMLDKGGTTEPHIVPQTSRDSSGEGRRAGAMLGSQYLGLQFHKLLHLQVFRLLVTGSS